MLPGQKECRNLFLEISCYNLNPFIPSRVFYLGILGESISRFMGGWISLFLFFSFKEKWTFFLISNGEDPDQTPHIAASDQGFHSLYSLFADTRLKWGNSKQAHSPSPDQ